MFSYLKKNKISSFKRGFTDTPMYRCGGFTLIEVLVSLSIFTMVVTMAVSVLLTMVDASSKARDVQSIMTNLAFTLDSMTREMRTGSDYYCQGGGGSSSLPTSGSTTNDCDASAAKRYAMSFNEGGGSITNSCSSKRISYRYNPTDLSVERRLCSGSWQRVTSKDIVVDDLNFSVTGSDSTDNITPIVTIYVKGHIPGVRGKDTNFSLQTTVSQHLLDI